MGKYLDSFRTKRGRTVIDHSVLTQITGCKFMKIRSGVISGKYIEWSSTIEMYVQRESDWFLLNDHFTLKFMNSIYFWVTENV